MFVSKCTWKRIVRANMKLYSEREWRIKVETSESGKSIWKITQMNQEYLFWNIAREYPIYYPFVQRARLLSQSPPYNVRFGYSIYSPMKQQKSTINS